jgi:hypothetical protein
VTLTAPLQRYLALKAQHTVRETVCSSHGVWRLSSTLMVVSQVSVTLRPRHLQGFLYTHLAATSLTTLPELSGALLGFLLQRFSPLPIGFPFPVHSPLAVGASELLDFRDLVGKDPLEPRLLVPLLVFCSFKAFTPGALRESLSSHGSLMCLDVIVPAGKMASALQGLFCAENRFPLSR